MHPGLARYSRVVHRKCTASQSRTATATNSAMKTHAAPFTGDSVADLTRAADRRSRLGQVVRSAAMSAIDDRLDQLGLTLPAPAKLPPGVEIPFEWARRRGRFVYVSGHGALAADGTPQGPFGRVPSEVSLEDARAVGAVGDARDAGVGEGGDRRFQQRRRLAHDQRLRERRPRLFRDDAC